MLRILHDTKIDFIRLWKITTVVTLLFIIPGRTTRLPLTPDKAGTFTFLCDIFCGSGHETMNGTLTVTP